MTVRKIYLSPSNQPANRYAVGNTNEKVEMEAVAKNIKDILDEKYDCEAVLATIPLSINIDGRPSEAKEKGCDFYFAIHSNAGGAGKASGATAFFQKDFDESKDLARNIVRELNNICPIQSNRYSPLIDGMTPYKGKGLAEIRNPLRLGIPAVLVEVDFHDNPKTARWIIDNKSAIARACVKALVETFAIPEKIGEAESQQPIKQYYRIQAGAYSHKENAEAMVNRLKAAGFDAFIKYY